LLRIDVAQAFIEQWASLKLGEHPLRVGDSSLQVCSMRDPSGLKAAEVSGQKASTLTAGRSICSIAGNASEGDFPGGGVLIGAEKGLFLAARIRNPSTDPRMVSCDMNLRARSICWRAPNRGFCSSTRARARVMGCYSESRKP
jgi:hypothetical protein